MQSKANTIEEYVALLPDDRKDAIIKLRKIFSKKLPKGFQECMSYGMIGYVVPHTLYPNGYHCNPKLPLPFINIASQKNFIAIYHMGIYADKKLYDWFIDEHTKQIPTKIDMGKSCLRYKNPALIPYDLIGELISKMTVKDWISTYESAFRKESKK
jgi:uncharacterized protein YdhG (YjbR/CyaY superfamily)